jgi:hypothetical protein
MLSRPHLDKGIKGRPFIPLNGVMMMNILNYSYRKNKNLKEE